MTFTYLYCPPLTPTEDMYLLKYLETPLLQFDEANILRPLFGFSTRPLYRGLNN